MYPLSSGLSACVVKARPSLFGRAHAGDIWSGDPHVQQRRFSSLGFERKILQFCFSSFPYSPFAGSLTVSSSSFFNFAAFGFSGSFFFLTGFEVSWWTTCSNSAATWNANEVTEEEVGVESPCRVDLFPTWFWSSNQTSVGVAGQLLKDSQLQLEAQVTSKLMPFLQGHPVGKSPTSGK